MCIFNNLKESTSIFALTPSMPRKSERLVRNSFFILRVEFNLLSGSGGGFSSSLASTGGGGGFSLGGSTLVNGLRRKGWAAMISSSLDKVSGRIWQTRQNHQRSVISI